MRVISSLALLALVALALAEGEQSSVRVLDAESFDTVVDGSRDVLVEFFAPWCGHCKRLAPEFEKAAKALSDVGNPGVLASVDCTQHQALCKRFEVRGYPTINFFARGGDVKAPKPYRGARTAQALMDSMPKPIAEAEDEEAPHEHVVPTDEL